jgi:uncharacterized membrane protein
MNASIFLYLLAVLIEEVTLKATFLATAGVFVLLYSVDEFNVTKKLPPFLIQLASILLIFCSVLLLSVIRLDSIPRHLVGTIDAILLLVIAFVKQTKPRKP